MSILAASNWQIPKDWEIVSIGEVSSDWRGGAPLKPEDFTEEGFPVLHKGAIQKGGKILIDGKKKTYTTTEYAKSHPKSVIDNSYMAVTLRDLVPTGPSIGLIADLAHSPSTKYILAQGAYGFHVDTDRVEPAYLVRLSNYELFRGYIKRYCVGSTQIHIRTPVFQELEIPLPPLEEQRRIAAILDKADSLREKRRQAITKLDTLLKAVFLDMFGDPVTNPKGWDVYSLGQVCNFVSGSTLPEGEPFKNQIGGYFLLKVSDMNLSGNEIFINYSQRWNSKPAAKSTLCPVNSIIIPKRGGAIGTNKKRLLTRAAVLDPNLMGLTPKESTLNSRFLFWWLQRFDLASITSGSSVPQLNKQDLIPLSIAVPPLAVQNDFQNTTDKFFSLRSKLQVTEQLTEELFISLQQRAFNGELFTERGEPKQSLNELSQYV